MADAVVVPTPPAPRVRTHRGRFLALYAVLALALAGAGAALVVGLTRDNTPPVSTVPWSDWVPTWDLYRQADAIAGHIAPLYRLPSGDPIAAVEAAPPHVGDTLIEGIALLKTPGGDPDVFATTQTVQYTICGNGAKCTITPGRSTHERGALLRREALELALYTFRYTDADAVVTLLPPPKGRDATASLFVRRSDVEDALRVPLDQAIGTDPPPVAEDLAPDVVQALDTITVPFLYAFGYQQLADGSPVMLLQAPQIQG